MRTSYDKTDRLDTPVFGSAKSRQVRQCETLIDGVSLADGSASGSLHQIVQAIARALSGGLRYEPVNDAPLHRSYPSPRGLFPVELRLVFTLDRLTFRLRYLSEHHAFVPLGPDIPDFVSHNWELRLEIIGALDRIAPLYGELALTLCALEAGHVAEQLCVQLRAASIVVDCHAAASPKPGEIDKGDFVAATIGFQNLRFAAPSKFESATSLRVSTYALVEEDQKQIAQAAAQLAAAPQHCVAIPAAGESKTEMRVPRSSGYFINGMFGRSAAPEELDAVCRLVVERHQASVAGTVIRPELTIIRSRPDRDAMTIRVGDPGLPRQITQGAVALADAYGTLFNFDPDTIPIVLIFSADLRAFTARGRAWRYVQLLVVAGVVAQGIASGAAGLGFFARPFKGVLEHRLEAAFGIPGQAVYTLLLGKAGAPNPGFSVDAL